MNRNALLWMLMVLSLTIEEIESLTVLGLFPYPRFSHFQFYHPVMRAIADAGHNVTVISYFPDASAPRNYVDFNLGDPGTITDFLNVTILAPQSSFRYLLDVYNFSNREKDACELAYRSDPIQDILNNRQQFDVILMELHLSDCMMGVAWKLKAPVIGLPCCGMLPWHYDRVSQPLIVSYVPSVVLGHTDRMTFTQRLSNWFSVTSMKLLHNYITLESVDAMIRKYIRDDDMPHLRDLVKETSMVFVNSHFSFSGPKPNAPTVIELGGIHIGETKPLDRELQEFLDSATEGVVYVSWGSMIRAETLPVEKRDSLLKAFGSLEQKVLWKWENEVLPNQPRNVVVRKWMAQRDILCHPNVRVFISHGGIFGSMESVFCGVPMVLIPWYFDQFLNAAAAVDRGMGVVVNYDDITEDTMKTAIGEALRPEMLQNARTVSYSFKNQPKTPAETAVWWTEYVAKTKGAPLLQSHSKYLTTVAYYSFDIYISICVACMITVTFCTFAVRRLMSRLVTKMKRKAE